MQPQADGAATQPPTQQGVKTAQPSPSQNSEQPRDQQQETQPPTQPTNHVHKQPPNATNLQSKNKSSSSDSQPIDATTIEGILQTMGVHLYDPRVTHQLLELLYRYVSTVLTDARIFSEHAEKTVIDAEDIKLAVRSRSSLNFTQPPPREVTSHLAAERNSVPLPPIEDHASITLPPQVYQLTRQNYRIMQANCAALEREKRKRDSAASSAPTRPSKRPAYIADPDVIIVDDPKPKSANSKAPPVTGALPPRPGTAPSPQPMEIVDLDAPPVPSASTIPAASMGHNAPPVGGLPSSRSAAVNLEALPPPPGSRPLLGQLGNSAASKPPS